MTPPKQVDILVVGGGIVGCAVAREAALRDWTVLLVEREDLASATSGRSTKLLHGGLRYLEHGDLRLVREALRERETTARLAPHLAPPLGFVLPTRRSIWPGPIAARTGVALYDLLAGRSPLPRGRRVSAREAAEMIGATEADGWTGGVLFSDRQTDDARLTLAVARAAARLGATIRTRAEVVELLSRRGGVSGAKVLFRDTGRTLEVPASVVVNAAGPWADGLRAMAGAHRTALRPTRGTHLVLPDLGLRRAVLFSGRLPRHRLFAIPWRGVTLFGTTDVDALVDDPVEPSAEEIRLLWDEVLRLFPRSGLRPSSVAHVFAGLRPLVRHGGESLALSREHRVLSERGLVSVIGGKLTTWRTMAEDAIAAAARGLGRSGRPHPRSPVEPLPGGGPAPAPDDPRFEGIPAETVLRWLGRYGDEATELAERLRADRTASEPLVPGEPALLAEVDFAVEREFAVGVEDVLVRRLGLEHRPGTMERAAPRVASRMRERLGWTVERERSEIADSIDRIRASRGRVASALDRSAPLTSP